jgi:secreted Zn-dependent insulinase-like peptidase
MSNLNSEPATGSWQQQENHSRFRNEIEKPQLDERLYSLIKLPNELQVLLISDPTTDLAGVSLDVGVGHMADPVREILFSYLDI